MAKKTAAGGKIRKTGIKLKQKTTSPPNGGGSAGSIPTKFMDQKKAEVKIQPTRIEKKRG